MGSDNAASKTGTQDNPSNESARGGKQRRLWEARVFASLAVADYRILWLGSVAAFLAMQTEFVARGYLAYTIGNSAIAIGMVQLAWGLPTILLSLFGGALADRIDKRVLLIAMQSLSGLAALTIAILVETNRIEIWHLVGTGLVQGVVFSFQMPARQSMIPEMVGKSRLSNAIALNTVGNNLSRVAGPAFAGTLIAAAWFGMAKTYFLIAGIYALVVITTWQLPSFPSRLTGPRESIVESVGSGLRFLRDSPLLLTLMGMAFVPIVLGLPYQALLPVFSVEVLALGAEGLGHLYAVNGAGALLGSLLVASLRTLDGKGVVQLALGGIFGLALVLFALSRDYWSALALLFFVGICSQSYLTINNTLVMTNTPIQYYGRVMSIYLLTFSVLPVATLPLSALADAIGVSATLAMTGSLIVIFILGLAMSNQWRRRYG